MSFRIAFFGTPAFALPTLERLLEAGHQVVVVVTQPDRPRGRGHQVQESPVKAEAVARGLEVWQPERLSDDAFLAALRARAPDLGVVAAYGKILPDALLALPPRGFLNVHASLLPKYRGAAPVHRAILAGESETGVTIMRIVRELDAGPMLARRARAIGEDETSVEVEADLARLGADLLVDVLDRLARGEVAETPQNPDEATYAPRLTRADGAIDWTRAAREVHNQVRGLHPWPHASTALEGRRYLIHRTRVGGPAPGGPVAPATVVEARGDRLLVAAGDGGTVQILEIQPEGRRVMTAREFLAGHPVTPGVRFGPPRAGA